MVRLVCCQRADVFINSSWTVHHQDTQRPFSLKEVRSWMWSTRFVQPGHAGVTGNVALEFRFDKPSCAAPPGYTVVGEVWAFVTRSELWRHCQFVIAHRSIYKSTKLSLLLQVNTYEFVFYQLNISTNEDIVVASVYWLESALMTPTFFV